MGVLKNKLNTCSLFVNTYKQPGDKKSEYLGHVNIERCQCYLAADLKDGEKGKYLEGRVTLIWNKHYYGKFLLYKFRGKKDEKQPDFRGFMTVKKVIQYEMSMWLMKNEAGLEYMSGSIKIKDPEMLTKGEALVTASNPNPIDENKF